MSSRVRGPTPPRGNDRATVEEPEMPASKRWSGGALECAHTIADVNQVGTDFVATCMCGASCLAFTRKALLLAAALDAGTITLEQLQGMAMFDDDAAAILAELLSGNEATDS
jgi:hypothetical protein